MGCKIGVICGVGCICGVGWRCPEEEREAWVEMSCWTSAACICCLLWDHMLGEEGVAYTCGGEGICEVMGEGICIMGGDSWKELDESRNTGDLGVPRGGDKRVLGAYPSNCDESLHSGTFLSTKRRVRNDESKGERERERGGTKYK